MLDRCLCLGLTGNRLVIFEIFLEQLQNLVFLLFFVFLFFIYFVSFVFLFLVLILSLEVCRLILHVSMISDIVMPKYFIVLFFLNIFCSKCSFFSYVGHRFFICKMWNKMFWRDKKKFHNPVILFLFWFVSFHNHSFRSQKRLTSEFLWLFWIFFHSFSFFTLFGGDFVFWGIFFCMWRRAGGSFFYHT